MTISQLAARFQQLQKSIEAQNYKGGAPAFVVRLEASGWVNNNTVFEVVDLLVEARNAGAFDDPRAGTLGDLIRDDPAPGWLPTFLEKLGRMTRTQLTGDDPHGRPVARIGDALTHMKTKLSPSLTRAYRKLAYWACKTREIEEAEARRAAQKAVARGK